MTPFHYEIISNSVILKRREAVVNMSWWKRKNRLTPKKKLTPYEIASLFLELTSDLVKTSKKSLETRLNIEQESKWTRVQWELLFFCIFSIDYWISQYPGRQQEKQTIREALFDKLEKMLRDNDSQAMLNSLKQCLDEYGAIVSGEQDDDFKLYNLGINLAKRCEFHKEPYFTVLAPQLFTAVQRSTRDILRQ